MAHPRMFEDDDPWLARVRELALALPEAAEKVSHGRPAFYTGKVFGYFGGSQKVAGEWVQHPRCVLVLCETAERVALLQQERCFAPAYLAPSGWVGVQLPALRSRGWGEVAELLDASYRQSASQRLVQRLDEAPSR